MNDDDNQTYLSPEEAMEAFKPTLSKMLKEELEASSDEIRALHTMHGAEESIRRAGVPTTQENVIKVLENMRDQGLNNPDEAVSGLFPKGTPTQEAPAATQPTPATPAEPLTKYNLQERLHQSLGGDEAFSPEQALETVTANLTEQALRGQNK